MQAGAAEGVSYSRKSTDRQPTLASRRAEAMISRGLGSGYPSGFTSMCV